MNIFFDNFVEQENKIWSYYLINKKKHFSEIDRKYGIEHQKRCESHIVDFLVQETCTIVIAGRFGYKMINH